MKLKFEHIIILGLLLIILFMRMCSPSPKPCPKLKPTTQIEVKWDTIYLETPIYIPKPYKVVYTDSFFKDIDTFSILKDYYAELYYNDSIISDSFKLYISDIITKNSILNRKIKSSIKQKTTTITNTIYVYDSIKPKNQLYYGFGIGAEPYNFNYFGLELLLKTKKDKIYKIGIGSNPSFKPTINGSIYWKVGKK